MGRQLKSGSADVRGDVPKPMGEGGEQLKPKEGHIYRAVDNAADASGNDKSFSNKTIWYRDWEGFLIEAKKAEGKIGRAHV